MDPAFLYLYYVGLGFWYGIRHPRDPALLERLHPHLDPMYLPLCYDGFGFKVGFFDHVRNPEARRRLDRCPGEYLSAAHQGFGRSLFFVYMIMYSAWRFGIAYFRVDKLFFGLSQAQIVSLVILAISIFLLLRLTRRFQAGEPDQNPPTQPPAENTS